MNIYNPNDINFFQVYLALHWVLNLKFSYILEEYCHDQLMLNAFFFFRLVYYIFNLYLDIHSGLFFILKKMHFDFQMSQWIVKNHYQNFLLIKFSIIKFWHSNFFHYLYELFISFPNFYSFNSLLQTTETSTFNPTDFFASFTIFVIYYHHYFTKFNILQLYLANFKCQ